MSNGDNVNVSFDGYRSYSDWGLMLEKIILSFPNPIENKITVPGMDGKLDLSEVNAPLNYDEREIKLIFSLMGNYEDWHELSSRIANLIHGKVVKIILGTDAGYYYLGRVRLESAKENDAYDDIIISGNVDPYKYDLNDGTEPWIWDIFSFRDGIIREYSNIVVNGTQSITIVGRKKRVIPTVTCSAPLILAYGSMTINLPAGTTKVYELQLGEGEHILRFAGNGTVTISYRGGSL